MSLSLIALEEKNKMAIDSLFLPCLEITIPGVDDAVRVVRDNQNLTWKGQTWVAFPFELDEIGNTSKGEVPQINIRVSNVSRVMESYLQDYDIYCKTYGYEAISVNIYVVNTKAVIANPNCDPEVEHSFILKQPKTDNTWATFVLGAVNIFAKRVPPGRMLKNTCRYVFKDARCNYTGSALVCNKTLAQCRIFNNSTRYGGSPGIGSGGIVSAAS
jgi:lambda family phage minor tail protein L